MTGQNIYNTKQLLRRRLRMKRQHLSDQYVTAASVAVCRHISTHALFLTHKKVGFYMAHENEVNLSSLLSHAFELQKICYCPEIYDRKNSLMAFTPVSKKTEWTPNAYGILQPDNSPSQRVDGRTIELMLLPLLAFDKEGGRLGMGGGYYDKFLGNLKTQRPLLVGVGYVWQSIQEVPSLPHDIQLDYAVTEQGWTSFR